MTAFHDMHCHLDFMTNACEVAAEAQTEGTLIFANTVTPQGWLDARERFGGFRNVAIGCGMHPWWVDFTPQRNADVQREGSQRATLRERKAAIEAQEDSPDERSNAQRADVLDFLEAHNPPIIGEIGLDFGWQHLESRTAQIEMFAAITEWAARRGGKLLSIHSVKSASEVIEILEASDVPNSCACLFHWFTGPSDLLKRAIDMGCFFSCGPRMLATRKGREYVKAIPPTRLLLETDAPPEQNMRYSYGELRAELSSVADSIAAIKGEEALETIAETSARLLGAKQIGV